MSVRNNPFQVHWGYLTVIPWYRQLIALVFGLGVMLIALWSIDQGSGPILITSVAGMAFLTLLLIFGIEIDSIEWGDKKIEFSSTSDNIAQQERKRED